MQFHWRARAEWRPERWWLQLVGFGGSTRERRRDTRSTPVEISGLDACRELFGV